MPTEAEINSIYNTSTGTFATGVAWDWISDTATYGTVGFEVYVTSDSSKKILPAAGRWSGVLGNAGNGGRYWSSSEYSNSARAWVLDFSSGLQDWGITSRYCGQSVRPVHN
ncbi:MAG: hypothetical protein II824_07695 [Bacteroidales bacterium]|nr:hypothetical protein [Bacteroidales bacterium]